MPSTSIVELRMIRRRTSRFGAVVLCGGESRRMGAAKAWLPFGPEYMLQRVVRLLGQVVDSIVVAAAAGQELPDLPPGVLIARDRRPDTGPLEGIGSGLAALPPPVEAAYVTACDVPLLVPEFAARMIELNDGYEAAVPVVDGRYQPLAAVYRRSVLAEVDRLLVRHRRRPVFLFRRVATRFVQPAELRDVDPRLMTFRNINHPDEYCEALRIAGLPVEGAGFPPRCASFAGGQKWLSDRETAP